MGEGAEPLTDIALWRALEVAKGAYADAMREHGLLPGTIQLIEARAQQNLDELIDSVEPPQHPS